MKNEIKVTITETGEVEVDMTGAKGTVEEIRKLLDDLTSRLGPITKERHLPGHHHGHEGLREQITGG
ncbi:MAG: hypothetical protein O7H41_16005 [Planctomycetota bacterium]|nr:hypothetical protein [Planctomycetota bacterium]